MGHQKILKQSAFNPEAERNKKRLCCLPMDQRNKKSYKQKNNKMVDLNPTTSFITLNIKGLNIDLKRHCQTLDNVVFKKLV